MEGLNRGQFSYTTHTDMHMCKVSYQNPTNQSRRLLKNGNHYLVSSTNSPTISTCTTATSLSTLDFQSNSIIHQKTMSTLGRNFLRTLSEIEPLNKKSVNEIGNEQNVINASTKELEALKSTDSLNNPLTSNSFKQIISQLVAAIAVSWVSMVIGYASAYTSPTSISLKRDLSITDKEISWIGGLMPLMALFGGLLGGPLIEYLGRKRTLLITDLIFLLAWMINFFATHYWYLYVSRMMIGCGVGIATLTLPVYLGETVQPEVRGTLGLLPTAFGNIGILVCFLLGNLLEWKGLAGVGVLLPIPFFLLIWFIPETPRWYLSKGKVDESKSALQWLRGKQSNIEKEFDELIRIHRSSNEKIENLSNLLTRNNVKPLLIVLGLMFFQQMSGINAIIFYTTQIFNDTGSNLDPSISTTIVGVVNFISTFVATLLIDRLGRKALLYISSVSIIITLSILGTYFFMLNVNHTNVLDFGWLPLASFVIYVLGFSLGFGPIPWLMMGEILPAKIRGPAASVCTGFNWSCTFIVTTTFPLFKDSIGSHGVFWLFGCLTILSLVFIVLFVPETSGQSLEDIERKLAGVKVRRMSSVANLKPLPSMF